MLHIVEKSAGYDFRLYVTVLFFTVVTPQVEC